MTGPHYLPPWATRPVHLCPSCRREPRAGERHEVLAGTSGPEDSPEPEYACLDAAGEVLPEPASWADLGVGSDPWASQGPVPPPPF